MSVTHANLASGLLLLGEDDTRDNDDDNDDDDDDDDDNAARAIAYRRLSLRANTRQR